MIVKSSNKKFTENINIKITNKDGTICCLERKDHIKYLGVLIDEKLSSKYHIAYICSRLAQYWYYLQIKTLYDFNSTLTTILQPYLPVYIICHIGQGKYL
jgi:hypothetical protein